MLPSYTCINKHKSQSAIQNANAVHKHKHKQKKKRTVQSYITYSQLASNNEHKPAAAFHPSPWTPGSSSPGSYRISGLPLRPRRRRRLLLPQSKKRNRYSGTRSPCSACGLRLRLRLCHQFPLPVSIDGIGDSAPRRRRA